jgi:hypothetical protein
MNAQYSRHERSFALPNTIARVTRQDPAGAVGPGGMTMNSLNCVVIARQGSISRHIVRSHANNGAAKARFLEGGWPPDESAPVPS